MKKDFYFLSNHSSLYYGRYCDFQLNSLPICHLNLDSSLFFTHHIAIPLLEVTGSNFTNQAVPGMFDNK